VRVLHDRVNKTVEYNNAWLEFAGVPILYTPYLSHPDPSVKRKSGVLPPRAGGSSDLGFVARVPYFQVIDEYSDVTLTPLVTSKEGGGISAEYRERFSNGELKVLGSVANDSTNNTLGHIAATTRFDIDETWRLGADLNRASDDTYMRRYGYGNSSVLTSKAYIEGFRGKNYMNVSTMAFQDLRATAQPCATPLALPMAHYSHQGEANRLGA